jgi:hypothetical protein
MKGSGSCRRVACQNKLAQVIIKRSTDHCQIPPRSGVFEPIHLSPGSYKSPVSVDAEDAFATWSLDESRNRHLPVPKACPRSIYACH